MVGDVITDVCFRVRDTVIGSPVELPQGVNTAKPNIVATIHRADNTDDEIRLKEIITALRDLSAPVVLLAHHVWLPGRSRSASTCVGVLCTPRLR
jgi:UDP-N-acetylglucosamine 2-epimerase (non-hydrolysing)